jgi:hypothetical protein
LVHEWEIEIGLKSQEVVRTMVPPSTKRELQQLIGKIYPDGSSHSWTW